MTHKETLHNSYIYLYY